MSGTIVIPNKSLFKMNEVCSITGVKPYVLRFWESEFAEINPTVSQSGQKLFSHGDIETIVLIKKLLFEDKMSIEEAKKSLLLNYNTSDQLREDIDPDQISSVDQGDGGGAESECLPDLPSETEVNNGQRELAFPLVEKNLKSHDIEKLVMAKEKINTLLSSIHQLKKRHNWS